MVPRDDRPQVALMGRSNVGKSSLLNRMLGRSSLARVSKAPGRTRELHFYEVDERLYIVDLPGFGFARVSQEARRGWARLVEGYLDSEGPLVLAIHLVDARHEPTPLDALMRDTLASRGIPTLVALTKGDKLRASAAAGAVHRSRRSLDLDDTIPVVLTSARTGLGMEALAREIGRSVDASRSRS